MKPSIDSVLGCILGGAIGDCVAGVPERKNLSLSDDTQLTLATCESICDTGNVSPEHIAATFLRWFCSNQITGLGSATLKALCDLRAGAHWALAGARGERAAGNGAAMRIAPLAFLLDFQDRADRVIIRDVCRITHHSDEAYIGALAILAAIRWPSWPPEPTFFENLASLLPDSRVRDRLIQYGDTPSDTDLSLVAKRFGSSGYVVETVPLAVWGAIGMTVHGFESMLDQIVRTAGDTDTIGSLAGQIAGTHLGYSRFPEDLLALASVQAAFPIGHSFAQIAAGGTERLEE